MWKRRLSECLESSWSLNSSLLVFVSKNIILSLLNNYKVIPSSHASRNIANHNLFSLLDYNPACLDAHLRSIYTSIYSHTIYDRDPHIYCFFSHIYVKIFT